MKNWTIGNRIMLGGAALLFLLLAVGGIGAYALKTIEQDAATRLRDDAIPGIIQMSDIMTATLRAHIRALTAANAATVEEREKNLTMMTELAADITKSMDAYAKAITVEDDAKNLETLQKTRAAYVAQRTDYIELVRAGKKAEAALLADEPWRRPSWPIATIRS